jgi:hypothetical protein
MGDGGTGRGAFGLPSGVFQFAIGNLQFAIFNCFFFNLFCAASKTKAIERQKQLKIEN